MSWSWLVTTFERPRVLRRCLGAIRRGWPDTPILVGDQSKDPAREIVADYGAANVLVGHDVGLSRARNELLRHAEARGDEFVAMIDDDIIVDSETLDPEMLFSYLVKFPILAVGPWVIQEPVRRRRPWFGYMSFDDEGYLRRIYPWKPLRWGKRLRRTDYLAPGALFTTTRLLRACPFNEELKLSEGLEWCWRAREYGLAIDLSQRVVHRQEKDESEVYEVCRGRGDAYEKRAWEIMGIKGVRGWIRG